MLTISHLIQYSEELYQTLFSKQRRFLCEDCFGRKYSTLFCVTLKMHLICSLCSILILLFICLHLKLRLRIDQMRIVYINKQLITKSQLIKLLLTVHQPLMLTNVVLYMSKKAGKVFSAISGFAIIFLLVGKQEKILKKLFGEERNCKVELSTKPYSMHVFFSHFCDWCY